MPFTVVPLHNVDLPVGSRIPFGAKFTISDLPDWIKKDKHTLENIAWNDRQAVLAAEHALISEYEADSYGYADSDLRGTQPRGIQETRYQSAFMANLTIWLIQPSPLCFTVVFHALTHLSGRKLEAPIINHTDRQGPFYCHPNENANNVTWRQLVKAAKIFEVLEAVPRNNAVWSSLRAVSAALASYYADYRYPLFWQALESLFGSDTDQDDITERLRVRISRFISSDRKGRRQIYTMVDRCYKTRCEIVHGRWANDPIIDSRMSETESIIRTVLINLARDPAMLAVFASTERDAFLQAWEREKNFATPPLPTV